MAAALWRQRISETFFQRLAAVVEATPRPEDDVDAAGEAQAQRMLAAMRPFQDHDHVMLAASELLVMARFDWQVSEAVARTWAAWADAWLQPVPGALTPAQAARNGFAISVALGLLVMGRGVPSPPAPVEGPLVDLVRALSVRAQPQPLPPERAEHLDLGAVFDTDDPAWDALLQATLDEVGTRGYDGATLEIIARSAGYSRGIIQNRYSSKKEIVLDATRRMLAAAVVLNDSYIRVITETYGAGLADAALMREFMDPSRRLIRSISFEQIRLAWHDPEVAAAMAAEVESARAMTGRSASGIESAAADSAWHFALSAGQGAALLADLHPHAASLPFDVVTTAVYDQLA